LFFPESSILKFPVPVWIYHAECKKYQDWFHFPHELKDCWQREYSKILPRSTEQRNTKGKNRQGTVLRIFDAVLTEIKKAGLIPQENGKGTEQKIFDLWFDFYHRWICFDTSEKIAEAAIPTLPYHSTGYYEDDTGLTDIFDIFPIVCGQYSCRLLKQSY